MTVPKERGIWSQGCVVSALLWQVPWILLLFLTASHQNPTQRADVATMWLIWSLRHR